MLGILDFSLGAIDRCLVRTSPESIQFRPADRKLGFSVLNVDCPDERSSPAPTRVKMRSTRPIDAAEAGTKLPHCAISTISATCRRYVDLPAMFGPVSTMICPSLDDRCASFGTNAPALSDRSTIGCRASRSSIASPSLSRGRT